MFKGLTLKILLPFTLVLLIIAILFNLYYPGKQEQFYLTNKKNELKELAKTVGLGVELSISDDNFNGLKKTLDFASERKDFEFIAIILEDDGEESLFTSFPVLPEKVVLKRNNKEYIYERSKFQTDDFKGFILIAASRKKMEDELFRLNLPVYISTIVIFIFSFVLYVIIARRITRPINELVEVTRKLQEENYENNQSIEYTNDEIGLLGRSIDDLQAKLLEQRANNKELYDGLEEEIKNRTRELEQATQDLINSQRAASIANYTICLKRQTMELPELFFQLLQIPFSEKLSVEYLISLVHSDDHSIFHKILNSNKVNDRFKYEIRFIGSEGNTIWLSFSGLVQTLTDSSDLIIKGLLHDITERKNYELEISRLSLVAKNTSNCVIITDADRKIIWANESAERITGYSFDEMKGNSPKMFQFGKTDPKTINTIREKINRKESVSCEILNRSKDGREYWLELNIVPLFNENKELYGYIAVETDITALKEASLQLEESEKQLRNILDNSSEMIHTLDAEGNVIWANRSWKENLKVSDEELQNRNISEFLDYPTKEEFNEVMPKLMVGESINDLNCGFYSTKGDHILLKGQTIPLFKNGEFVGSQAYLHNVTQIIKAQRELQAISEMQQVLMEISFDFLNTDLFKTKEAIRNSMNKIGDLLGAFKIEINNLSGGESILEHQLVNDSVSVFNTDEVSEISYDLIRDNQIIGKLIISIPSAKEISLQEAELVKLYTSLLVNVEDRYLSLKMINESKLEIERINTTLENKVLENTKRNLDLSKTIVEQEKMATVGEISAGIAHDLNTPLGAIKIGAESIQYSLNSIFERISELSTEESTFLFEIAKNRSIEVFIGGIQLMRDSKSLQDHLTETLHIEHPNLKKIADNLVKSGLKHNDEKIIKRIFELPNPEAFSELLFNVLTTNSMVSSVSDSVAKASDVVQNIRSFIKKDVASGLQRKEVNLKENIRIVLNIFSFEFKKNTELLVDLQDDLIIKGFDVKLFQLWSNLVKNAFDAMEENSNKKLLISGKKEENKVIVSFSNNGPMIPEEIQDQIFKKFFSTKKHKNGTGLGLSIVQSVIHEHGASINLESTPELTTFRIIFVNKD